MAMIVDQAGRLIFKGFLPASGAKVFILSTIMVVGVGCKSLPPKVETVTVTVKELVPVPEELTKPCDPIEKRGNSYGEMKRVVNARAASLAECSARMEKIRSLGR